MDPGAQSSQSRFEDYLERLAATLGHADRVEPMRDYCSGLLLPGERKSVEPMAAIVAPERTAAKHQSLLHFVGEAPWSDEAMLTKVRELVQQDIEAQGKIEAWIVDDTGIAKKGVHSVGVARQYIGRLGKVDNCQVAVTLSIANRAASLPVAYRLYLPRDWAEDDARREKAHVPKDVKFQTKHEIALAQIKAALAAGVPPGVVLADAAYGTSGEFRAEITAMGLTYAVGVKSQLTVWPLSEEASAPEAGSGHGRKPAEADQEPVSVRALAMKLPEEAWRTVSWREGSNETLSSRFAAVRVRPARDRELAATPPALEWLLIEWPEGEKEPAKYWLSTLPEDAPLEVLVDTVKLRWRIERDYEELKSELGLAHFEGRGWRGFHHHATLCIAAYGFLIREKAAFPPSGPRERQRPGLSDSRKRRGAPDPNRKARGQLDRDRASQAYRSPRPLPQPLPLLSTRKSRNCTPSSLVRQRAEKCGSG
jgi:SRSO17 transposase